MEAVSGDNWSYKTCKAPVKSSPPTNQHRVYTGRMSFLSSNQQCQSTEGKKYLDDLVLIPSKTHTNLVASSRPSSKLNSRLACLVHSWSIIRKLSARHRGQV